uniref:DUF559 domain-containing protein n=1 Tax=Carboxylicivirga agarovorans TaxID=3417570 RepID=UPI003D340E28
IGQYILDFYCPQLKLAIELDGEYHVYNEEYDSLGIGILVMWVLQHYDTKILWYLNTQML